LNRVRHCSAGSDAHVRRAAVSEDTHVEIGGVCHSDRCRQRGEGQPNRLHRNETPRRLTNSTRRRAAAGKVGGSIGAVPRNP
jgi:hypothetical protein